MSFNTLFIFFIAGNSVRFMDKLIEDKQRKGEEDGFSYAEFMHYLYK